MNENNEQQSGQMPTPFNQNIEPYSSEKNKSNASIVNDDTSEEQAPSKIEKVIKDSNIKKTSKYQSEHKNYEFIIDNEKVSFDIINGELRCKRHNKKMIKYSLTDITPQKVEEDKENSCYQLIITKGKNIIFKILNQDKANLENFYFDLIEAK